MFIIEGETETAQEAKLFWEQQNFELLKNAEPCTETIKEFETLKPQINKERCVDLKKLHTVFLMVCKKEAIELFDDKLNLTVIPIILIVLYQ